jgi:hypothetical protein
MRIFAVAFAFAVGLAALAVAVNQVSAKGVAVSLTKEQVATVCGKKLQSGGGHTGCTKACGNKGQYVCDFDCDKSKNKCEGSCFTCQQRKFPYGANFPAHVVLMSVKTATP